MERKYFKNVETFDELKKAYRDLMKKWHPDLNPDNQEEATRIAKEINAEFDWLFDRIPNTRVNKDGQTYEAHKEFETPAEFKHIIDILIKYSNIEIDVIGSWLWVSGETKPIKEILKDLKFKWHDVKKCWYYKNTRRKSSLAANLNFDDLINIYGGAKYNTNQKNDSENPEANRLALGM